MSDKMKADEDGVKRATARLYKVGRVGCDVAPDGVGVYAGRGACQDRVDELNGKPVAVGDLVYGQYLVIRGRFQVEVVDEDTVPKVHGPTHHHFVSGPMCGETRAAIHGSCLMVSRAVRVEILDTRKAPTPQMVFHDLYVLRGVNLYYCGSYMNSAAAKDAEGKLS